MLETSEYDCRFHSFKGLQTVAPLPGYIMRSAATFVNCVHFTKITPLFRLSGAPHIVISPNAACKPTHSRCGPLPKKCWISMAYIKHQNMLCLHETPQLECKLCLYVFQTTATWPDITLALPAWLRSENRLPVSYSAYGTSTFSCCSWRWLQTSTKSLATSKARCWQKTVCLTMPL